MAYCSPDRVLTYFDTPNFLSLTLHILTAIAIPTHIFGAYCILFKTPARMSSVKWSLLHLHFWTCVVDLGFNLLTAPVILIPVFAGFPLGILRFTGLSMENQTYFMIVIIASLGISIVGVFENRYHVLSTDNHFWHRARIPWFIGNFGIAFFLFIPVYCEFPKDHINGKEYVLKMLPCLPEDVKSADIFLSSENPAFFMELEAFQITVLFLQALIFCFLINRWFNQYGTKLSSKTISMQKKLMRSLIFQLLLPLVILVFPLSYGAVSSMIGYHNQAYNNLLFIIISTHGFLSTVSMIIMHQPYRNEALRILRCGRVNSIGDTTSGRWSMTTKAISRKNTVILS